MSPVGKEEWPTLAGLRISGRGAVLETKVTWSWRMGFSASCARCHLRLPSAAEDGQVHKVHGKEEPHHLCPMSRPPLGLLARLKLQVQAATGRYRPPENIFPGAETLQTSHLVAPRRKLRAEGPQKRIKEKKRRTQKKRKERESASGGRKVLSSPALQMIMEPPSRAHAQSVSNCADATVATVALIRNLERRRIPQ